MVIEGIATPTDLRGPGLALWVGFIEKWAVLRDAATTYWQQYSKLK